MTESVSNNGKIYFPFSVTQGDEINTSGYEYEYVFSKY
uniref:Uncharacterized protein n=1 Tax=Anguilla anguilla TaxID=7936 RepID=A0A0E9U4A8_ANGAN